MVTSFARMTVLCHRADEARRFYEALGFAPIFEGRLANGRPLLHLGLEAQPGVGLWLIEAEGERQAALVGAQTGDTPAMVLYCDDLDADVETVVAAGGTLVRRGEDPSARSAHVRDPAGNVIVLAELVA
ncbi:MAG: Glyoxalase/bleomycin resistance protein/dioxygenase [Conexibacter sp.]|nr:Glyoxalase/bleomycin resistance protein/dioxygenase [Conexibacter sp.]